jgi:hypothetical protein
VALTQATPDDLTLRRRWRLFLYVDGLLLLITLGMTRVMIAFSVKWLIHPLVVLSMWLVITLPICFLYLIGRPPVMSLYPLAASHEARALRRELKQRPLLTDDEFYARFYADSAIPPDVPARVRLCVSTNFDRLADRTVPTDNLARLCEDFDYADVLSYVGREFGVQFTKEDFPSVDGTLDNTIRLVHARLCGSR